MEVKIFRMSGTFWMGEKEQPFVKEFRAVNKENAIERLYSDLGSKHRVKRVRIKIEDIKEISPEEAKDILIKELSMEGEDD